MSGSGGGGGTGGTPVSDCASIIRQTTLNSPNPNVLKQLKPKDHLLVALGPEGDRIEAQNQQGDVAGSITFTGVSALKRCLEEGWSFFAIVLSIDGGDCRIEVRPGTP